ncbi:cytochrome P450, partial [Kitasatospora indigofera]|uniref:cytochrome P450 n=1 Tax=Kitasatospora indigofera TaxID=67307 RepID=UPI00369CBF9E
MTFGLTTDPPRPAGPQGSPLTGCLREYRTDLLSFVTKCARRYGDFVPVRVASHRGYLISDPALVGDVLNERTGDYRKVFMLRNNRLFLGDGLLTSDGEDWRNKRTEARPIFKASSLKEYAPIMTQEAERMGEIWAAGGTRDVQNDMMDVALRVIVRCLFGGDADIDVARATKDINIIQSRMNKRVRSLVPLPDTAPTPFNIGLRLAVHDLNKMIYGWAKNAPDADLPVRSSNASATISDPRDIGNFRDRAMTMMFAGHETTALALSWSWHLLAQNTEAYARMHNEIDTVLGDHPPTFDDLPRLRVVRQVIRESLRLFPPIYAFGRDAVRDTSVGGQRIPAGQSAMIAPWVIHRDPRWFPQPDEFHPERWSEEFERNLPKFAYLPFGGGPRACIGKHFAMNEAILG